jgi:HAD superfamily hydrolase (TIGR01509 family)
MLRGVIFDHDGTLVDTEKQHYRVWNQLLNSLGHHLPEDEYVREHSGVPTIGSATYLVKRFDLPMTPEQLCHTKEKQLQALTEVPALMPGAREILLHLHRHRVPMAVATGARLLEVERNLHNHELHSLFQAVCSSSHVERNKPAPDVYLLAADKLNLAPAECLAVEDTLTGMRSALAAGMQCVVIPSADTEQDFSAATHIMRDLDTLLRWCSDTLIKPIMAEA